MQYSRNDVYKFIREVFSSHEFQSRSESDKKLAIDVIANHPLIITNNITKDEIMKFYDHQRLLTTEALNKLGRDPLFLILARSKPNDVLSLCQTTPAYARLCRDDEVFTRLLALHYPKLATMKKKNNDEENGGGTTSKDRYIRHTRGYQVWTFGRNVDGQLGHGDKRSRSTPTPIKDRFGQNLDAIVQVSCGYNHMAMIDITGQVWTFGSGTYGQLGHGDSENKLIPTAIEGFNNTGVKRRIIQVSCGSKHTSMLDYIGQVWTFGYGESAKTDLGKITTPILVEGITNIVQISCGTKHTMILDAKGQVWAFGKGNNNIGLVTVRIEAFDNAAGVKRDTAGVKRDTAGVKRDTAGVKRDIIQVTGYHMLDNTGQAWSLNYISIMDINPTRVKDISNINIEPKRDIIQISSTYDHIAMIDSNGKVWTFGLGHHGELGHNDKQNRLVPTLIKNFNNASQVTCGDRHTAIIDTKGQIWTFGNNKFGQLGNGDELTDIHYREDINVLIPTAIDGFNNVVQVSCGSDFTALLTRN